MATHKRVPKVQGNHIPEEAPILHDQWVVQAQRGADMLDHFRGAFGPQRRCDRVSWQNAQDKEDHGGQDEDHREGQGNPGQDITAKSRRTSRKNVR